MTLRDQAFLDKQPVTFDPTSKPSNPKDAIGSNELQFVKPISATEIREIMGQPKVSELREGDKQSNPKHAAGDVKLPIHLVPHAAVAAESLVFLVGASKYGRNNWRESGVLASTYFAAAMRHLMAWMEGEEIDPETGTTHLASVRACCGIIIDAEVHGKLIDDRNYKPTGSDIAFAQYMGKLSAEVPRIRREFADRTPQHFDRRLHEGRK